MGPLSLMPGYHEILETRCHYEQPARLNLAKCP